jgi:hypothetical protein
VGGRIAGSPGGIQFRDLNIGVAVQDGSLTVWMVVSLIVLLAAGTMLIRWRKRPMYRKELPHIYELRDLLPDPLPPKAYFQNLDNSLSEIPQKLRQYRDLEGDLAGLDPVAWAFLKSEVKPLLQTKHEKRGWEPLFDKLGQAKAYNHLKRAGYESVSFVPPSSVASRMTPDLEAVKGLQRALCEVKTINVSEIEANRRFSKGVAHIRDQLEAGFFGKLAADLAQAEAQMRAFDDGAALKLAYVIINFDDSLHEYADRYSEQIERYMAENPRSGLQVVFDWKPPFGSASI